MEKGISVSGIRVMSKSLEIIKHNLCIVLKKNDRVSIGIIEGVGILLYVFTPIYKTEASPMAIYEIHRVDMGKIEERSFDLKDALESKKW